MTMVSYGKRKKTQDDGMAYKRDWTNHIILCNPLR
jgi:hypothetical protein